MKINIGFGINDKFAQHCACTMASVLVNSNPEDDYSFYILYEVLSDENKSKIEELKKIRPFNVEFIGVDIEEFREFTQYSLVNIESFFRIKLFSMEKVDKILYFDSDIIVRRDIGPLFSTNIKNYCLAGAKDIIWDSLRKKYNLSENSIYVNAGVLLINIKKIREMDIKPKILEFISLYKDSPYSDQDIINYVFQEQILEFDISYNFAFPYINEYEQNYYKSVSEDPYIVHYITDTKPWKADVSCYMKSEYFKYLSYTSYYDEFMNTYRIEENAAIISKLVNIEQLLMTNMSQFRQPQFTKPHVFPQQQERHPQI